MTHTVDAVVLDYGNVISLPQRRELIDPIRQAIGYNWDRFYELYNSHRGRLDAGELDLPAFWRQTLAEVGISATPGQLDEYARADRDSWSAINEATLAWVRALRGADYHVGLLTNMPVDFYEQVLEPAEWLTLFDTAVISGTVGMIKPHGEIFAHLVERLGVPADRALFLDDLQHNVEGARAAGLYAEQFVSAEETIPRVAAVYGLPEIPALNPDRPE